MLHTKTTNINQNSPEHIGKNDQPTDYGFSQRENKTLQNTFYHYVFKALGNNCEMNKWACLPEAYLHYQLQHKIFAQIKVIYK